MSDLSPERKKVVILFAAVACMGGGSVLLRGHAILLGMWILVMVVVLVYAMSRFVRLNKQGQ